MAPQRKMGRPSRYHRDFGQRLIEHLGGGYTFESFGAEVGVHRDTLYEWANRHPEFSDAKKMGEARRAKFLIKMGQGIALGTHRYLAAETPVMHNGHEVRGSDGKVLLERTYRPSKCNAAVWIFMAKNMMGWRDASDINLAGQKNGAPITVRDKRELTPQERQAEIAEIAQMLKVVGDD